MAQLLEELAVFGHFDGMAASAQKLGAAFGKNAFFLELDRKVESGLSADAGQDRVRALFSDDLGNVLHGQGFHVNFIRDGSVRHDGGRVGVAQDDLIALLFQGEAGLGAGVVELGGLPDHDGAGADDEYFMDIVAFRHLTPPSIP